MQTGSALLWFILAALTLPAAAPGQAALVYPSVRSSFLGPAYKIECFEGHVAAAGRDSSRVVGIGTPLKFVDRACLANRVVNGGPVCYAGEKRHEQRISIYTLLVVPVRFSPCNLGLIYMSCILKADRIIWEHSESDIAFSSELVSKGNLFGRKIALHWRTSVNLGVNSMSGNIPYVNHLDNKHDAAALVSPDDWAAQHKFCLDPWTQRCGERLPSHVGLLHRGSGGSLCVNKGFLEGSQLAFGRTPELPGDLPQRKGEYGDSYSRESSDCSVILTCRLPDTSCVQCQLN